MKNLRHAAFFQSKAEEQIVKVAEIWPKFIQLLTAHDSHPKTEHHVLGMLTNTNCSSSKVYLTQASTFSWGFIILA